MSIPIALLFVAVFAYHRATGAPVSIRRASRPHLSLSHSSVSAQRGQRRFRPATVRKRPESQTAAEATKRRGQ
jgi:hypothetical protein